MDEVYANPLAGQSGARWNALVDQQRRYHGAMDPARLAPLAGSLLMAAALHGPPGGAPGQSASNAAADPDRPRTEVEVAGSGGEFHYMPTCSSTFHRAAFVEAQARVRHRRGGLSLSGEAAHMQAKVRADVAPVTSDPPPGPMGSPSGNAPAPGAPAEGPPPSTVSNPPPPGRTSEGRSELDPGTSAWRTNTVVAARIGYHFRYAGGEAGPAFIYLRAGHDAATPFPSARLWAGVPDRLYWWASLWAEETAAPSRFIGTGLGHQTDSLRLSLGVGGSAGDRGSAWGDALFLLPDGIWIGGGLQAGPPHPDRGGRLWSATLRAALGF